MELTLKNVLNCRKPQKGCRLRFLKVSTMQKTSGVNKLIYIEKTSQKNWTTHILATKRPSKQQLLFQMCVLSQIQIIICKPSRGFHKALNGGTVKTFKKEE